jgi:hypothetical protein
MYEDSNYYPDGSFFERWIPGVCKHLKVRCTHGQETVKRKFHRRVCLTCGRSLDGPLPKMCFFTGKEHENERGVEKNPRF